MSVTLLCRLGFWQISRGQTKQAQVQAFENGPLMAPLENLLMDEPLPPRFTPVILTGRFLNDRTFLLDNKINNGRVGYHVLTPFQLKNGLILLVDRGWVALTGSRSQLPTILPISGEVTIEGYLNFAYLNPLIKDLIENNEVKWPLRIQQVDLKALSSLLGENVFPMLVNFKAPCLYSFEVPPFQSEEFPPERHFGYAFQWFSLALTLSILYIWFLFRQSRSGSKIA